MSKQVTDKLLIVFLESPLPNLKNKGIGVDDSYENAVEHTLSVTKNTDAKRHLYYPNEIIEGDNWPRTHFIKYSHESCDRGELMKQAFRNGFKKGYGRIVCMGVCCPDITQQDIQKAFDALNSKHAVIGPSDDGGYYLIGLSMPIETIFDNKPWGENTVFKKTYLELMMYNKTIALLEEKQMHRTENTTTN